MIALFSLFSVISIMTAANFTTIPFFSFLTRQEIVPFLIKMLLELPIYDCTTKLLFFFCVSLTYRVKFVSALDRVKFVS